MKTSIIALAALFVVFFSSLGQCDSKVFQLGFTIPATASLANSQNNINQSADLKAQTQQLVRGNKVQVVTSIVEL